METIIIWCYSKVTLCLSYRRQEMEDLWLSLHKKVALWPDACISVHCGEAYKPYQVNWFCCPWWTVMMKLLKLICNHTAVPNISSDTTPASSHFCFYLSPLSHYLWNPSIGECSVRQVIIYLLQGWGVLIIGAGFIWEADSKCTLRGQNLSFITWRGWLEDSVLGVVS